jgi:hypothetical protein
MFSVSVRQKAAEELATYWENELSPEAPQEESPLITNNPEPGAEIEEGVTARRAAAEESSMRGEADKGRRVAISPEHVGEEKEAFHLQRFTPAGYDLVLGDMVEAEEEGYDTFPRSYAHIEKNYILKRISTCSRDKWFQHLVNDGFAINHLGLNRGRIRPGARR